MEDAHGFYKIEQGLFERQFLSFSNWFLVDSTEGLDLFRFMEAFKGIIRSICTKLTRKRPNL
jgi:hypothetical protein